MADAFITLNQTIDGKVAANVLAFSNIQEDVVSLTAVADAIRASFAIHAEDHMVFAWSLDSITVAFIDGDHISYSIDVPFTNGALFGANASDMLPSQISLLISTGFIGAKPNRGRIYFMGLGENNTTDNVWNASLVTAFELLVEGWRDGLAAAPDTVFLRIMSRPTPERPSYLSSPVETVTGRARIATQRRRRRGGL